MSSNCSESVGSGTSPYSKETANEDAAAPGKRIIRADGDGGQRPSARVLRREWGRLVGEFPKYKSLLDFSSASFVEFYERIIEEVIRGRPVALDTGIVLSALKSKHPLRRWCNLRMLYIVGDELVDEETTRAVVIAALKDKQHRVVIAGLVLLQKLVRVNQCLDFSEAAAYKYIRSKWLELQVSAQKVYFALVNRGEKVESLERATEFFLCSKSEKLKKNAVLMLDEMTKRGLNYAITERVLELILEVEDLELRRAGYHVLVRMVKDDLYLDFSEELAQRFFEADDPIILSYECVVFQELIKRGRTIDIASKISLEYIRGSTCYVKPAVRVLAFLLRRALSVEDAMEAAQLLIESDFPVRSVSGLRLLGELVDVGLLLNEAEDAAERFFWSHSRREYISSVRLFIKLLDKGRALDTAVRVATENVAQGELGNCEPGYKLLQHLVRRSYGVERVVEILKSKTGDEDFPMRLDLKLIRTLVIEGEDTEIAEIAAERGLAKYSRNTSLGQSCLELIMEIAKKGEGNRFIDSELLSMATRSSKWKNQRVRVLQAYIKSGRCLELGEEVAHNLIMSDQKYYSKLGLKIFIELSMKNSGEETMKSVLFALIALDTEKFPEKGRELFKILCRQGVIVPEVFEMAVDLVEDPESNYRDRRNGMKMLKYAVKAGYGGEKAERCAMKAAMSKDRKLVLIGLWTLRILVMRGRAYENSFRMAADLMGEDSESLRFNALRVLHALVEKHKKKVGVPGVAMVGLIDVSKKVRLESVKTLRTLCRKVETWN